ncbi:MAG: hypothetical protein K0R17_3016 [Rariglobus sp.]|jgi:hypothetical protein|nr:hypothetical protein [Rariglobus sp.]
MISRVPFIVLMWLIFTGDARASDSPDALTGPRTFIDVFGRSIEAEIVSLGAMEVVMKRHPDGVEFTLALDRLSDNDREFLAEHREAIVKKLTPLPETAFTTALRKDFRVLKRSGLALEPVPAQLWAKTRYFVMVYGLSDSPEATSGVVRVISEEITRKLAGRPVAVLWLGPSNANGPKPPPIPEGDLKVAKLLPPGVAIVSVEAVARDGELVDAEIEAIARDESPEDPRLFHVSGYRSRHEVVRAVWRKRILSKIAPYWPGCVYRWTFDRPGPGGTARTFIVDREGRPVPGANGAPLEGSTPAMIRAAVSLTDAEK